MWLLLTIIALPLIEIALFVLIGGAIGVWWTLAWIVLAAMLGIVVLKGIATTGGMSISQDMRDMSDPMSPLAHRAMVTIAGTLLIIPGFFTDAVALLLLVPPVRTAIIKLIGLRFRQGVHIRGTTVVDADWKEVEIDPPVTQQDKPPSEWTRH